MRSRSPAEPGAVRRRSARRSGGSDTGSATVELAVALPVVLLVLAGCLGAVQFGIATGRAQAVAADTARALARGDDPGVVMPRARSELPGATVQRYGLAGGLVCVQVWAPPGPLATLVHATATAKSCALGEEG